MTWYANVELQGEILTVPAAVGDDLFVQLAVGQSSFFKVIAPGDTLEGFSPGDQLRVSGRITRTYPKTVVRATSAMTPPAKS